MVVVAPTCNWIMHGDRVRVLFVWYKILVDIRWIPGLDSRSGHNLL